MCSTDSFTRLVYSTIVLASIQAEVDPCPAQCNCTKFEVNCAHAGYKDFPDGFPKEMQILNFKINYVSQLTQRNMNPLANLQTLNLRTNNISLIEVDAFANMTNLVELMLDSNPLAILKDFVFSPLRRLRTLTLSQTNITVNPKAFVNLTLLSELRISNAGLRTFPEFYLHNKAVLPKLERLTLNSNSIDSVRRELLRGMDALSNLALKGNRISKIDGNNFAGLRNLKTISLDDNCRLKNVAYNAFNSTSLRQLSLSNTGFKVNQGSGAYVFQYIVNIMSLYLKNAEIIHNRGLIFQNLRSLVVLDLTNVNLAGLLPSEMFANISQLKSLHMSKTNIGTYLNGDLFHPVADSLKELDLADNKIAIINRTSLPEKLWSRLKRIDLSGNPFVCDCSLIWFRRWMKTANVSIFRTRDGSSNIKKYKCNGPSELHGVPIVELSNPTVEECTQAPYDWVFLMMLIVSLSLIIVSSIASLLHRFRWHVKYWVFLYQVILIFFGI